MKIAVALASLVIGAFLYQYFTDKEWLVAVERSYFMCFGGAFVYYSLKFRGELK